MRKRNAIGVSTVVYFSVIAIILLAHMSYANRQSIQFKVRSITSVSSEDALADLIGNHDGVTSATPGPGIEDLPETRCLVYNGPSKLRFRLSRKFPFVKKHQIQEYVRVLILGRDKLDRIDHINDDLRWGPVYFDRAIVVLEHELSPNPKRIRDERFLEQVKQSREEKKSFGGQSGTKLDLYIEKLEQMLSQEPDAF